MIDFNFRCKNRRALTIIETVVSLTILLIVLLTYASSNQAKKTILKSLTHQTFYNRLANVQLERLITFVHNNKQLSKDFYSTNKSDVATGDFKSFTEVFSFEGINGKLDEFDAASTPNIALHQLEVRGTDIGDNDYHNGGEDKSRFLAFPYPNELKAKSVYDPSALWTDPHSKSGTLHHITPKLNENDGGQRKYRGVLPLVSEEFVTLSDDGTRNELGFEDGSALAADDVQLSAGTSLFLNPGTIGTWENERIRRYVYYRKIREGNIVFRSNVRGIGTSQAEGDTTLAAQNTNVMVTTDIENLYIQSLNNWETADGSSNGGEVVGIEGTAYPDDVGGAGAHSIYLMVVVRAIDLDEIDDATPASLNDVDFLSQSEIKAVACGIATPTYGKNLLKSIELSYHRYNFSRIPGTKLYRQ